MKSLHYFNPENDLALAAGTPNYTPPKAALNLQRAGLLLPLWYGSPGDKILCYGANAKWLDAIQKSFCIDVDVYNHTDQLEPAPWGWSLLSRKAFVDEGIDPSLLPSLDRIEMLRQLSHRRTAAEVDNRLRQLCTDIEFAAPPAIEARNMQEVDEAFEALGEVVIKVPWSSSGRGVSNTMLNGREATYKMAFDSIKSQGSVMIEKAVDKAIDFAQIFECRSGKCSAIGTSVFVTDTRGVYCGNMLAAQSVRRDAVAKHCNIADLDKITSALESILASIYTPYYSGIIGVDMLADRDGRIDPVVEINLRKTMGYVANVFADKYLETGITGEFRVKPTKNIGYEENYSVEGGKLTGGCLYLTPSNPHFTFIARCY